MRWIVFVALFACAPPPGANEPDPPPIEETVHTESVEESCDSNSSEQVQMSTADPCLDSQDFELPLTCARECSGCGEQDCDVWCTGAGSRSRLDLSGCDFDELFAG